MLRLLVLLLLTAALPATGQQGAEPPVSRPVPRALPIPDENGIATPPPLPGAATPVAIDRTPPPENVPPAGPLDVKPTGEDALRLQIFLDEANFGPGVIDGKPGHFTELAVASWNEVNGHPFNDWTAVNTAARKAVLLIGSMGVLTELKEEEPASAPCCDTGRPSRRRLDAEGADATAKRSCRVVWPLDGCDVFRQLENRRV